MPSPAVATVGLRKLQRDLGKMGVESGVLLRGVIRTGTQIAAGDARAHARRRTGEYAGAFVGQARGLRGSITNRLPQARPLEYGGRISPKGTPIQLPKLMTATQAVERTTGQVEHSLLIGFTALARANGWAGA